MANGEVAQAARVLQSNGVAAANDATAETLRGILSPNPSQQPPDRAWIERHKSIAAGVSWKPFWKTLRSAAKGGACDLAGWHYEHLQLALGREFTFAAILDVCSLLARGLLSSDFYDASTLGRATPLCKWLKSKFRPLVCGSTWRRLTMSALCSTHKDQFRAYLGFDQYAMGVKAALEKLSATLSVLLKMHPDAAVIQVDAVSAFNHMLCESMLEELDQCCPQLVCMLSQWLARESITVLFIEYGRIVEFATGVGVDQGCPGSPIAFALGMRKALSRICQRIQTWLDELPPNPARDAVLSILSYLDDSSLVIPPEAVEAAIPIVKEELKAVGLNMSADKSLCWAPSKRCPPGPLADRLWANANRHDGMVLCGCPFAGLATIDDTEDDLDLDTALPVGSMSFIDAFLSSYRQKNATLVWSIVDLPSMCSPGRFAVRSSSLLLRYCCAQKATHVTRLLPPERVRTLALYVENVVHEGYCKLNGLCGLESWQRTAITLPISRGGCGLRSLTNTCEAAFVGAWLQCAPHVATVTGQELADDDNHVFPDFRKALLDLQELYGVDVLSTLGMSCRDFVTNGRERAQRDLSRAVTEVMHKQWHSNLEPLVSTQALQATKLRALGIGCSPLPDPRQLPSRTMPSFVVFEHGFALAWSHLLPIALASFNPTIAHVLRS